MAVCKGCGAAIFWRLVKRQNKPPGRMPLDAEPLEGAHFVLGADGETARHVKVYVSHFATCTKADDFRHYRRHAGVEPDGEG